MLINVPSVTEKGLKSLAELKETCKPITRLNEAKTGETAIIVYQENSTGVYFTLPVVLGDSGPGGGLDDQYDFPYSAAYLTSRIVERKERDVITTEVYYE